MEKFAADIFHGLMASPKYISPKYFYDKEGSRIYTNISALAEYYPSRCEAEILSTYKSDLREILSKSDKRFEIIEFGAGDGAKTRILISHFLEHGQEIHYVPIDICQEENDNLVDELLRTFPELPVRSITGEFMESINMITNQPDTGKLILFLGSTIGNLPQEESLEFLRSVNEKMSKDDLLLIGFDLKKHPKLIADAYNDSKGYTRQFNLNLLKRINTELEADFDLDRFEHYPVYDPVTGEAKSYLVSSSRQEVFIRKLGKVFMFNEGEIIFTEVSRKYSVEDIESLATTTGFQVERNFTDSQGYFVDSLWRK